MGLVMAEYENAGARFYDLYDRGLPGDVDFYVEEAKRSDAPVLEIGCGTGRCLLPLAKAGLEVVGLDRSAQMLAIAREKMETFQPSLLERVTLAEGDMEAFALDEVFGAILVPHRTFMHALSPEAQRNTLTCIHRHLKPGGRLIFNIVSPPEVDVLTHSGYNSAPMQLDSTFIDPSTGCKVFCWGARFYEPTEQRIELSYVFDETDSQGQVIGRTYTTISVRYSYRFEMEHLLALCGFEVEALYGDFSRGPYRLPCEQVWIARKARR